LQLITLITTTLELQALVQKYVASPPPFLAMDTEFMRDKTYWPELCLIQCATPDEIVLIDPLVPGFDMTSLGELLKHTSITKIFHACRQDIEALYQYFNLVPSPLFDTQVASMLVHDIYMPSYDALVKGLGKDALDKSFQRQNWRKRPLSDDVIAYAANDVRYLGPIYRGLLKDLEKQGRQAWMTEEMELLGQPPIQSPLPNAWTNVKNTHPVISASSPWPFVALEELARWREEQAIQNNLPRAWICHDEVLIKRSFLFPNSNFFDLFSKSIYWTPDVQEELKAQAQQAEGTLPRPPRFQRPSEDMKKRYQQLRDLRDACAEDLGIPAPFLATRSQLEALSRSSGLASLGRWRKQVLQQKELIADVEEKFSSKPPCRS
jgi:ribonuclease D